MTNKLAKNLKAIRFRKGKLVLACVSDQETNNKFGKSFLSPDSSRLKKASDLEMVLETVIVVKQEIG